MRSKEMKKNTKYKMRNTTTSSPASGGWKRQGGEIAFSLSLTFLVTASPSPPTDPTPP